MNNFEVSVARKYRNHVLLYDYSSNHYRNDEKRREAIDDIVANINLERLVDVEMQVIVTTAAIVKKTYEGLRGEYRSLQHRIRRENLEVDALQGRDRDLYDYLSFLRPYVHAEDGSVMV